MNRRVSGVGRVLGKSARLSNVGPPMAAGGGINKSGLQRRASMHGKIAQPRSDPRPINDRGFQQECIRTLTGYLMTHGYNVAISTKLLVSPTSKDILNIVQFLFQKVDPNMKFLGKIEEDVPVVFKRVGYPFQISKSALYAAGSPHTWPGLLAALTWLVQLLLHQESTESAEVFDDTGAKPFFENLSKSYQCFLAGDDDECERLDSMFRQQFEDSKAELIERVAKLNVGEVEAQLQKLATEPSPLVSLEAKKADFLGDKQKFNQINSSLQWHKQAAEKKLEERKQDLVAKRAEKDAILADIEELRKRIAAQEINAAEVERMQKEKEILEVNIEPVAAKEQQLRKAAWDHEIQASKKFKDLETICAEYNERCQRLKPNLAEGQHMTGALLQIKLQPQATVPEEILGKSVTDGLKQTILEVMESCKRYTAQEKDGALACEQEVYAGEAARQEKLDLISRNIASIKKLEALYKGQKEKLDAAFAAIVAEREELEANVAAKELASKRSDADAEELIKQWQLKYKAGVSSCAKEVALKKKEWLEVVDVILSAKEHVNELLQNLLSRTTQDVETVKRDLSAHHTAFLSLQV